MAYQLASEPLCDTFNIKDYPMYTIEIRCEKCQNYHNKKYNNLALHEVLICIKSMEMDLLSCKILCEKCGSVGPARIRIKDVTSAVFFEKIITPIVPHTKSNTYNVLDKFKKLGKPPCFLCKGIGSIEIEYKAHKTIDLKGIYTEKCPLCLGKGYLKK